ncbi:hypothetical protein [Rhizobium phaseoli]|uniref:hypothetical protein n=1 Tax=Rhizobium phaseoli TaxID=396 RepID=UPI00049741AA|nr:hypothetical protein [Rhizobium phaseoli]KKZ89035.1 hypothetical protein RPHASCH2410_CH00130 [Rhizobium phaseoli Ch24-10]
MNFVAHKHQRGPSRAELTAMMIDFTAAGGEVRSFNRGFTGDWSYLQDLLKGFGYEAKIDKAFYIVRKIGEKGRPKRLSRTAAIKAIDEVLVANGLQPFMITKHEFREVRP